MTAKLHPASDSLVEAVAAAFHEVIRGWHYNLRAAIEANAKGSGRVELEPQMQPTSDPAWQAQPKNGVVDIANTGWLDLPSDWRSEFVAMAKDAAEAVVIEVEVGVDLIELDQDAAFIAQVAARLVRDWMDDLPRVIVDGTASTDIAAGTSWLARVAIHVYAARAAGLQGIATVPPFPPPDFSDKSNFVRVGGEDPHAEIYVAFRISGDRLDPERISELTGLTPDHWARKGDLRVSRSTGTLYAPFSKGLWSISSESAVGRQGTALEEHLCYLLDLLAPHASELRQLIADQELSADFFTFYAQRQWNAGWELSPETLSRIAELDAALGLDIFLSADDEDEADDT